MLLEYAPEKLKKKYNFEHIFSEEQAEEYKQELK